MSDSISKNSMILPAFIGFVFITNALICQFLILDGGFVSSISSLIAALVMIVPMIRAFIQDIRKNELKMHELVILAVLASFIQSSGSDSDSNALLISACIAFFMLIAMIVESRTATGAHASLEALAKLSPGKARRLLSDGSTEEVESQELVIGDTIIVRPGENILADGEIITGRSSINEANITGESLPVDKGPQEKVFAGTNNLTGIIRIQVLKAGENTTIGKVRELILTAEQSKLPFVRMIDEYIRFYTPIVLVAAATVWFFTRDLDRVVALLVVACPIALILATPTAVVASLSAAARLGILVKDVNDLEAMASVDAFVFDKTGTLTCGELEVAAICPNEGISSAKVLECAAIAEHSSNHPVAKAIINMAHKAHIPHQEPKSLHEEPGRGVRAEYEDMTIIAGNLKWMKDNGIEADDFRDSHDNREETMSLLYVLCNGVPLGWIGLHDKVRAGAVQAVTDLHEHGVSHTSIVSGDKAGVVKEVSEDTGVKFFRGDCSPIDKVQEIEKLQADGHFVAFVGDGVNDGPALATSQIGIAMGAGSSDVALESATIALMNNELNRLPFLKTLANRMKKTVLINFILGAVFILGGVSLSALGILEPIIAAALQAGGSLLVAMNSATLIRQGEELEDEQENLDV